MSKDKDALPDLGVRGLTAAHHQERLVPGEPLYPILSIDELPPISDQCDELPYEYRKMLNPEEKVVHIHEPEHIWPRRHLTAEEVIFKAMRARSVRELGHMGPIVASVHVGEEDTKMSRYETEHGRDALRVAEDVYERYPQVLDAVITSLAESQGVENEKFIKGQPYREEKIGSIILVNRSPHDPVAQKFKRRLLWDQPFYGSVDAPATFINDIHRRYKDVPGYLKETQYRPRDMQGVKANLSLAFERAVTWLINNSEEHDGLIAYNNRQPAGKGMRNQGWRDSSTAMMHSNGDWANEEFGVAPIEVQGYAFDAFQNAAQIYREYFKDIKKADELDERAWHLLKQVTENGFLDGRFVSGFDWDENRHLRPINTTTSAPGRLLGSKFAQLDIPEIQATVRQTVFSLFTEGLLTKWGLRTLSSAEEIYVPWLYHHSVWTQDTLATAENCSKIGYFGLDRILGATTTYQHRKTGVFYEHVSGDDSLEEPIIPGQDIYIFNERYQELYLWMQTPPPGQTWSASSEFAKQIRYNRIPRHAIDPQKLSDEKRIWQTQIPDSVKAVVSFEDQELALALSK